MSKSIPNRTRSPGVEGATVAPSRHSIEQFRLHLLERLPEAARVKLRSIGSVEATSGNGLRELWEKSDLPAGIFADEVAGFWKLPRAGLQQLTNVQGAVEHFSPRFLRESSVFPFRLGDDGFGLAVSDPADGAAIRAAEIVCGRPVAIAVASFDDIATGLELRRDERTAEAGGVEGPEQRTGDDDIDSLRDLASGAPVVRAVNDVLERAMELRASDIHIEPFRTGLVVRMRVDGILRAVPFPGDAPPQAVVSRIKILAGLNIAERRLPQDGAARARVGRTEIDIRIATMPTQHGESVVIRLLPRDRGLLDLSKIGLYGRDEAALRRLLALPHGLILITGPTGSGKTTTLATMLSILNEPTRKILTIEDPVEYEIPGVNQSQANPAIGLPFATAVRAVVRQDPAGIMVGEIRDSETANIAIHAALAGHLVLPSLPTRAASAAVPRLIDLGIEGFLLKSTLRAVVAQRLVRVLCDRCKVPHSLTAGDIETDPRLAVIGFNAGEVIHEAGGCERCGGTGYRGPKRGSQILERSDDVRKLIGPQTDSHTIDTAAMRAGMTTMLHDAVLNCRAGLTTVPEVFRVTTVR